MALEAVYDDDDYSEKKKKTREHRYNVIYELRKNRVHYDKIFIFQRAK